MEDNKKQIIKESLKNLESWAKYGISESCGSSDEKIESEKIQKNIEVIEELINNQSLNAKNNPDDISVSSGNKSGDVAKVKDSKCDALPSGKPCNLVVENSAKAEDGRFDSPQGDII